MSFTSDTNIVGSRWTGVECVTAKNEELSKHYCITGHKRWAHRPMWSSWTSLQWRHNEYDGVSNHQPHDCIFNRLFRRRWKKMPKLRVTGLCEENSPVTGEFPTQMASNAENVSIWWRHHDNCYSWADTKFKLTGLQLRPLLLTWISNYIHCNSRDPAARCWQRARTLSRPRVRSGNIHCNVWDALTCALSNSTVAPLKFGNG